MRSTIIPSLHLAQPHEQTIVVIIDNEDDTIEFDFPPFASRVLVDVVVLCRRRHNSSAEA